MPTGSSTVKTRGGASKPATANRVDRLSAKKLKYLKNPKTPRLPAILSASQSFRWESFFASWMTRPQMKSSSVEKTIRPRNRQSQKP